MSKIQFYISLIIVCLHTLVKAEAYQFTFTASGESTMIDEIEVQNITKGVSNTINGNDILVLEDSEASLTTGIYQLDKRIKTYPNPMQNSATVEIYSTGIGDTHLRIYDLSGKTVLQKSIKLSEGRHLFELQSLKAGLYFIVCAVGDYKTSTKISVNGNGVSPSVRYVGHTKVSDSPLKARQSINHVNMKYSAGDVILLIAKSGQYRRIIPLQPKVRVQNINFHFVRCVDASGNHYPVVTIGEQTWMAENLKTNMFNNGDLIPTTSSSVEAESNPVYQWTYNNDNSNLDIFGRLYTWYAQADTRGVAPEGWRIPTDEEWKQLEMFLGMSREMADATTNPRGTVEGSKLKSTVSDFWLNTVNTENSTGFTATGAGRRNADGSFQGLREYAYYWSADESSPTNSRSRRLAANETTINRYNTSKKFGFTVRCILDTQVQSPWAPVPEIDLSMLSVDDFADDELDIPYYLKHLSTVANAVVETGETRGYINLHIYRSTTENVPVNARIMENILSFVYFYVTNRPWNVYYASKELKVRTEAAIEYLLSLQKSSGLFPDQSYVNGGMGTTAFITKFIGEAIVLLKQSDGPQLNTELMSRLLQAQRKAIMELLNNDVHYNWGKNYTNQYTNTYAGALAYLSLFEDEQMRSKLSERINQSKVDFQSTVGFFYESTGHGPDHGYNMNTHFSNLWMCYHYSHGTELATEFHTEADAYTEWIRYNAVLEPNSNAFTLNRAIATRTDYGVLEKDWFINLSPFGENNPVIRAFIFSQDELNNQKLTSRQQQQTNWPSVGNLSIGSASAYNPYTFLHRNHYSWYANAIQKEESINALPYLAQESFNHQKRDPRKGSVFTYIKRPRYYAAFASGPKASGGQRFGLTLLWNPIAGTFMQSVNDSGTAAWGTIRSGATNTYEANISGITFTIGGRSISPVDGAKDLPQGDIQLQYAIGSGNTKKIEFNSDSILVDINHTGEFTEFIPLVVGPGDQLTTSRPGFITLRSGNTTIRIDHGTVINRQVVTSIKVGDKTIVVLRLTANDSLNYSITFS